MSSSSQHPIYNEGSITSGARASVVNRTHRVVREQALAMRARKQRSRSLLAPIALCSILLLVTCYAAWDLLDGSDLTSNGVLDASYQSLVFLAWSLPATILVGGLVWLQRSRARSNGDV